jgi:hypothetical protein
MDSNNKRTHFKTKKPHVLCGFLPTEVVRTVEWNNSLTSHICIKTKPD